MQDSDWPDRLRRPAATWHRNDAERRRVRDARLQGGSSFRWNRRCGGASACSSRGASTRSQPVSAERVLKMLRAAGSSFAVRASQFGRGRLLEVISLQPAVERVLKLPPSDGLLTDRGVLVASCLSSRTPPHCERGRYDRFAPRDRFAPQGGLKGREAARNGRVTARNDRTRQRAELDPASSCDPAQFGLN